MKEEKEDYIPKFKLGQKVKYVGNIDLPNKTGRKLIYTTIDEIINYNTVKGYFPQARPIKEDWRGDDGCCQYIIGDKWHVYEKDLEAIQRKRRN